jgi:hypothetical protein
VQGGAHTITVYKEADIGFKRIRYHLQLFRLEEEKGKGLVELSAWEDCEYAGVIDLLGLTAKRKEF